MSISIVSAALTASGGWAVFWVQLPVLVVVAAVIVVATTALRRARPEDIPRVFEAFAAAFGWRARPPEQQQTRNYDANEPLAHAEEDDEPNA
ncbi:hypothetical protein [Nocardia wallacei]|uniref:hypothetical protein n=1 Tax=Nocardia wallacei TaxID=480035 RepID=UPI002457B66B|nr:hypothetical protein [Nocardia wallacei]